MAGHNKWSKIKRHKEKTDSQKSKIFGKLLRAISVEAKRSKGNTNDPSLRSAVEKARAANVPSDNIEKAIKKASETSAGLESVLYEAYGPGGVALIISALTSNRNKASQEIKFILSENNASLAAQGSALWAFEKTVDGWFPKQTVSLSEAEITSLEKLLGALEESDEVQDVYVNAE